jgi:hypothetical protein
MHKITLPAKASQILDKAMLGKNLSAELNWKCEVDLDLHAIVRTKSATVTREVKVKKLFGSKIETKTFTATPGVTHIYYANHRRSEPYSGCCVWITEDQGVGNLGPKAPEVLHFEVPEALEEVLIYCHNFGTNKPFNTYDGVCTVKLGSFEIEVKLDSPERKMYCVIAKIVRTGDSLKLININEMVESSPQLADYSSIQ